MKLKIENKNQMAKINNAQFATKFLKIIIRAQIVLIMHAMTVGKNG